MPAHAEPTSPSSVAQAPDESDLDAAIAALPFRPSRRRSSPPVAPPAPAVEHDWLTQPLEEVSEPPAEVVRRPSLVQEVVEPVAPSRSRPRPHRSPRTTPCPSVDPELDLPTAVLPELAAGAAWPEPRAAEPALEVEPETRRQSPSRPQGPLLQEGARS